jgi:MoaA/NifB/PqqE/SkfB family radical SAM enzyme
MTEGGDTVSLAARGAALGGTRVAVNSVDVWYLCNQSLCNFDCAYCVTQRDRRAAGARLWATEDGAARYRRVLAWLAALPWTLRVRLQTLGEPFVSRELLEGAAWLSRQAGTEFVELVTNGSFRAEQFRQFAAEADPRRVSLWMTYHPTQIDLDRLLAAAQVAHSSGASVVVHGLLFPDTVEAVREMVARCRAAGLRTDVTAGHNYNGAYGAAGFVPLLEDGEAMALYRDDAVLTAMKQAHRRVFGSPCSAGHDYIYVDPQGDVFPCSPYARSSMHRLGSALEEGFVPPLRAGACSPCQYRGPCACKEDYLHLASVRSTVEMGRSLGYYVRTERKGMTG